MKPVNKIESNWLYWRNNHPNMRSVKKGHTRWLKRQMARARRRFGKKLISNTYDVPAEIVDVMSKNFWDII